MAQEISATGAEIANAESEQLRDRTARSEIAHLADLADELVSPEAVHLRSMLAPDTACPVCGSTDHPHLAHPSVVNEMVATVRRRRQELDAALAATSLRLGAATRSLAAAEARQSETNRGIDIARRQLLAAAGDFAERRSLLSDACAMAGLATPAPLEPNDQGTSDLVTVTGTARAERLSVVSPLADARRLRTEIDGLRQEHDALGVAIDVATGNIEERRSGLHAAQLKVNEYSVRGVDLTDRLEFIGREIAPFLVAGDRTPEELDVDPEGVAAALTIVAEEYGALRKQIGELDLTLQRLARDRAVAAASLEHAQLQVTETAARLDQRRSIVDEKMLARAGLLDGEATGVHRTRINEARRTARGNARGRARGEVDRRCCAPGRRCSLRGSRVGVGGRKATSNLSGRYVRRGLPWRRALA